MADLTAAREFARITIRKRKLEAEIKNMRRQLASLGETAMLEMASEGLERFRLTVDVDGEDHSLTLYVQQTLRVRPKRCEECSGSGEVESEPGVMVRCEHCGGIGELDRRVLVDALYEDDLEDLVKTTVDLRSLSSWASEEIATHGSLPEHVSAVVDIHEQAELRARKG